MLDTLLHSFILDVIFGLHLVVIAIILLSRADYYRRLIQNTHEMSYSMFMVNALIVLLGLFLVMIHNVWVLEPKVMVTIICWVILVRSVLWLSSPERMLAMTKKVVASKGFYALLLFRLVLGALILSRGFMLFISDTALKHT